ncbi:MAG: threonine--tRNA ligase [Myxococcales bacterium]|nr:threonine--tRNA ligase [Myxococcales bacterium]
MQPDDHRNLGNKLDLFHFQEDAPGMVFWHPRGLAIYRELEEAARRHVRREGYREVRGPQVLRRAIWDKSGHWDHFRENMFILEDEPARLAALKPVSCPGHLEIVARMAPSFRDLPLRLAELGVCHRNEQSGALSGLFRLRQFVQDDGHVFCSEAQVASEVARFCASIRPFYGAFGFEDIHVALAGRPESRLGDDASWDRAEAQLAQGAKAGGLDPELAPGGGAFYGPKLEIGLRDRSGRSWQCGTIQLDFFLPERFGVEYVDSDGSHKRPAMLHRALYGSLERFLAIVLEHHRGRLPPWLSPEQVRILPLHDSEQGAARLLAHELEERRIRVEIDPSGESIKKRVALAHAWEVPFVVVIGPKEVEGGFVDLRDRDGRSAVARGEIVARLEEVVRPPL